MTFTLRAIIRRLRWEWIRHHRCRACQHPAIGFTRINRSPKRYWCGKHFGTALNFKGGQ